MTGSTLRTRLILLALALAVGSAALAVPALGFRTKGSPWPRGVIPYHNAAPDQAWAVTQAVTAWNTSGARVRFVPVARTSAQLVIEYAPTRVCQRAEATLGYGPRRTVRIWSSRVVPASCSPAFAATAMAHELGHVLGLTHEDRGCAVMNSSASARGPKLCDPVERWEWRCRLLEHDDVAGAVAVYGGSVRPGRAPACAIYAAIEPPRVESAELDPSGVLQLGLRRPASPRIPSPLSAQAKSEEAYAVAWGSSCPTKIDLSKTSRYVWPRPSDGVVQIRRPAPTAPGRYCLAIWSVDSLVRPSDRPVTVSVDVP